MSDDIVEVSKSLLANLQGTAKLTNDLWNDPTIGPKVKELVKDKYPNANIPEVDLARNAKRPRAKFLPRLRKPIRPL